MEWFDPSFLIPTKNDFYGFKRKKSKKSCEVFYSYSFHAPLLPLNEYEDENGKLKLTFPLNKFSFS